MAAAIFRRGRSRCRRGSPANSYRTGTRLRPPEVSPLPIKFVFPPLIEPFLDGPLNWSTREPLGKRHFERNRFLTSRTIRGEDDPVLAVLPFELPVRSSTQCNVGHA